MNRERMDLDMYGDESVDFQDTDYAADEVDDMLDTLIESDESQDLAERRRRGRRGRGRRGAAPVPTARGVTAYRAPAPQGNVTQAQLQEALARVGTDVRRNAEGIKTINSQLGRLTDQVKDVVTVNSAHGNRIGRLDKLTQLDAALEFAASYNGQELNLFQLFKGAVKSGMLGDHLGAFGNPLLVGGIGFVLNNRPLFGNLLGPPPGP